MKSTVSVWEQLICELKRIYQYNFSQVAIENLTEVLTFLIM